MDKKALEPLMLTVAGALFYLENHAFILRKYKRSSQLKGDRRANEVVEMAFHRHSYHCNSAYWLMSIYSKRAWLGTRAVLTSTEVRTKLCLQ